MPQQPGTSRGSVALAGVFVVLALAAFAAAFYLFDGAGIVADTAGSLGLLGSDEAQVPPAPPASAEATLTLPVGMSEQFALRLWQEQVDSQPMIARLRSGEIKTLSIDKVVKTGDEALLNVTVVMKDGTSGPGVIGLRKLGGKYYVAYASTERNGAASAPNGALPAIEEVDVDLLNTILAEQVKSSATIQEYVDGRVKRVNLNTITPGPNTTTIAVEMDEDHEEGYADIVLIGDKAGADTLWFIARFNKTGSEPIKQ